MPMYLVDNAKPFEDQPVGTYRVISDQGGTIVYHSELLSWEDINNSLIVRPEFRERVLAAREKII